jgi:hypothetical protein
MADPPSSCDVPGLVREVEFDWERGWSGDPGDGFPGARPVRMGLGIRGVMDAYCFGELESGQVRAE